MFKPWLDQFFPLYGMFPSYLTFPILLIFGEALHFLYFRECLNLRTRFLNASKIESFLKTL